MTKLSSVCVYGSLFMLWAGAAMANTESPYAIREISLLPHQVGVCDVIFAGTVVSTNFDDKTPIYPYYELPAAEFAVNDVLWGSLISSNIIVRSINPADSFRFMLQERYLVCAFTNNWWANESQDDTYYQRLYNYLSVTSRPPGNVVFEDYYTMYPRDTAIPFSRINYNGSNYWTVTRSVVTNMVDIARVHQDEQLMRHTITNIIGVGQSKSGLPAVIWNQLWMYKSHRYDWADRNPPPTPSPPSP